MKSNCPIGRYKTKALRRLRSSRAKYILIFITAAAFLSTYFSSITYEIIFNRATELRFPDYPGNASSYASISDRPKNVFFLKVHKCASSTIQNILMRYGKKHELNFVLPYTSNYLGHPMPFDPSMALPVSEDARYNLFCHHTRYERRSVRQILPDDSLFVTILRDPVQLFESLYSYFDLRSFYQMNLTEFVKMPRWWLRTCDRYYRRIGINQIAYDLGMDDSDFADFVEIRRFLEEIHGNFDLVLIAEYFDESLVLLKHLLKMDTEDVVYFVHNQRLRSARIVLSEDDRRRIVAANHVDQLIYEHFLAVFRKKIAAFGETRMRDEVAELREVIGRWRDACGVEHVDNDQVSEVMFKELSNMVRAIRVTKNRENFCENLAKSEIPFTSQLREVHLAKHGTAWLKFLYAAGYYRI